VWHRIPGADSKEDIVSKIVNCECGEIIKADSDDELVRKVEQHVSEAHPELAGKMSREDVLAMAEDT
jgi:predicted small metal-binding protein